MADNTATETGGSRYENLFSEFSAPTYEEWKEAAIASLKGAPFEKKVFTKTYEDITLEPMYTREGVEDVAHLGTMPGFAPYVRGTRPEGYLVKPWLICQEVPYALPEDVDKALAYDLPRGQTAVALKLDAATRAGVNPMDADADDVGRGGMSLATAGDLVKALASVDPETVPLHVCTGAVAAPVAALFAAWARGKGRDASALRGVIGADPLSVLARDGRLPCSIEAAYDAMAGYALWAKDNAPDLQSVLIHGAVYHNAGASATQELAYAAATAVEYLRAMTERGVPVDDAAKQIRFVFAAGRNFFMEIAKLRAARIVWCRIVEAFGGGEEARKMRIHCRTSQWTKTVCDPYVNMLRNTVEAFAGAMGGADSMHVAHFDEPVRIPDEFSRRVSRNVQIILQDECHFTRPVDQSGGSFAVEKLTEQVGKKAWEIFQGVEAEGGMLKALQSNLPQQACEETAKKKLAGFSTRKDVIVGTNMYANVQEKKIEPRPLDHAAIKAEREKDVSPGKAADQVGALAGANKASADVVALGAGAAVEGATLGELAAAVFGNTQSPTVIPVRTHRAAEPYEKLREAAKDHEEKAGGMVKVFLANMGPIPQHKARADFSTGFFQVGGFEVLTNNGFSTPKEAADAALASGARIAVICSTDKAYPGIVPDLARAIKDGDGEMTVILAGKPASDELAETYRQAGVDDWIHIRANCLEMLTNLQKKYGVEHE
ncbi:MAG: methylmalonyl-CoA mutase family protein [Desulfatibacillaceae bacterium]